MVLNTEAVAQRCFVKKVFQQISELNRKTPVLESLKGAFSGLRQFLVNESPLKMMKNAFYFISKAFFVLKTFKFLS